MRENDFHHLQQQNVAFREEVANVCALATDLHAQVKHLEDHLSKSSQKSYLPLFSDRFRRQPTGCATRCTFVAPVSSQARSMLQFFAVKGSQMLM